jgi:hypothetical protein
MTDAAQASFDSQFELNIAGYLVRHKRPNDPPDNIIVMPGMHRAWQAGDWALYLGLDGRDLPPGIWKLRVTAEAGPSLTTISGDNSGPCVWIKDYVDVEIKGFTITNCFIKHDYYINELQAVFIQSYSHARVRLEGNQIVSNSTMGGVAISPAFVGLRDVNIQIVRNLIAGNHSGILFQSFPVRVVPEDDARIVVANNIIVGNSGSVSPYLAVGIGMGPETIVAEQNLHIDVLNNTVTGFRGAGVFVNTDASELNVQNNIVYGNRFDIFGGTFRTHHNLVGETANMYASGNVVGNPQFIDAPAGNYGLQGLSPAIDAGVSMDNAEAATDYYGTPRPKDGDRNGVTASDIGAIEYAP